ncbi:MAG: MBOAT family protein [Clostridia bacterium]|nr:MBOAT family protein [Clostridia bacterium]
MTFSSSVFLFLFLPAFLLGYYLIRPSFRNGFVVFCSLVFYGWGEPRFLLVMICSVLMNYLLGLLADADREAFWRKTAVTLCVVMNLGLLFVYKYLGFFVTTLNQVASKAWPVPQIALPIGISFFTFQGMSYVIDVYRREVRAQKNPFRTMLYVVMFPQLIAGPIVRYKDIAAQIDHRSVNLDRMKAGIARFMVGLAKKMMLANTMGAVVDEIFAVDPASLAVPTAWLGAICYAMQIYYDFSGYSDMAIGLGKMIGFEFQENFRQPYVADSIKDFWRRWHISLSEWFRDYLYFPLGGSRRGNVYLHLAAVFLATGIWHGATWNFVLWGVWHGAFRILEYALEKKAGRRIRGVAGWIYTMLVVLIGWVLFRADNLGYAWSYLRRMFGLLPASFIPYSFGWYFTPKTGMVLLAALLVAVVPGMKFYAPLRRSIEARSWTRGLRRMVVIVLFLYSLALVMTSTYNPFIYFRF